MQRLVGHVVKGSANSPALEIGFILTLHSPVRSSRLQKAPCSSWLCWKQASPRQPEQSAVTVLAPHLPFLTKLFPTFVMNQKEFHGTSFLGVVCGRKQPKGKAGGACGFVHVRRVDHFQCPETGVNCSKL